MNYSKCLYPKCWYPIVHTLVSDYELVSNYHIQSVGTQLFKVLANYRVCE